MKYQSLREAAQNGQGCLTEKEVAEFLFYEFEESDFYSYIGNKFDGIVLHSVQNGYFVKNTQTTEILFFNFREV
jgi:hypothetical protein